jgi:hypothetical protein
MSRWCPYRGLVVTFTTNVAAPGVRAGQLAVERAGRLAAEVVTTPAVFDDRGGAVAGIVTIG